MNISRYLFLPTISRWQMVTTILALFAAFLMWPSPWAPLVFLGSVVFGGAVEGVVAAFNDEVAGQ